MNNKIEEISFEEGNRERSEFIDALVKNETTELGSHTESIKCPECDTVQDAKVEHTAPFYSYVHTCVNEDCRYVITESEWNKSNTENKEG